MFYVAKGDKLKGCIENFLLPYTPGPRALSRGWLSAESSSAVRCGSTRLPPSPRSRALLCISEWHP